MQRHSETHPWITFALPNLTDQWRTWQLFGEAASKCEHLAGSPVKPGTAQEMLQVSLIKGAHATTAIEGNTLSEDDVASIAAGTRTMPPSQQYQETEVVNVLHALRDLDDAIENNRPLPLNRQRICDINRMLLDGTDLAEGVVPGEVRSHEVIVGGGVYRGAPAEDCARLLDRLCAWLNGPDFSPADPDQQRAMGFTKAVMAHVYLAWIHPFGDGNGRTARLVEAQILAQSGFVPMPGINLLSDHYNKTRDKYYRLLNEASRREPTGDLRPFIHYAMQGFVDGIRGQIEKVRADQLDSAWRNHVFATTGDLPHTETTERRRALVFALSAGNPTPAAGIPRLTTELAFAYGPKSKKTVTRDLNALKSLHLIRKVGRGWVANQRIMEGFLPPVHAGE